MVKFKYEIGARVLFGTKEGTTERGEIVTAVVNVEMSDIPFYRIKRDDNGEIDTVSQRNIKRVL